VKIEDDVSQVAFNQKLFFTEHDETQRGLSGSTSKEYGVDRPVVLVFITKQKKRILR